MVKENFIRLFEDSFRQHWELPGYSDYGENKTLTYADIARQVARLHILFEQCDIRRNDRIALIGRNSANWAITYLATVTYGAVIVPILQDFNPNDVHHIVNHSESKLLFATDNLWDSLEEEKMTLVKAAFSLQTFNCLALLNQKEPDEDESDTPELIDRLDRNRLQPDSIEALFNNKYPNGFDRNSVSYADKDNSDIACLNYTSGTTGFSKGVMLTGNNMAGNVVFGIRSRLLQQGERVLAFLPLAHAYGCAFDFLTATAVGTHVTFLGKTPSPKILMKAFGEVKPDLIITVPLVIEKIYKNVILPLISKPVLKLALNVPLIDQTIYAQIRKKLVEALGGNFKEVIIGGAAMNPEVTDFFHKIKFPFTIGYGMTECGPLISYAPWDEFIPSSAGRILPNMEVRIDSDDPYNTTGEIQVRGEHVMSGYYKNEEATREVFTADGWLRTGDLGTIDADGFIYIRGRSKTMILSSNGQNIFPEEIESKLNNMPYVLESIVIERDRKLVALVCPDYGQADTQNLSQEQLEAIMEENRTALNNILGRYEKISKIELHPHEFEKTPKKSIKRYLYKA